ncbi:hypothetical protein G6F32_015485 [Rhizopus arrhizus]|nr:hypothetical protein G6F32_015485 [Rhizopus arrhizus]
MGVAGQLQVVAQRFGRGGAARLVGQQDFGAGVRGRTRQCGLRIAALLRVERAGAVIRHARHHHGQARRMDHGVFVHQHAQPHAAELRHPGRGA